MESKNIIERCFISVFLEAYYEYKTNTFYLEKDRLNYMFCKNELDKRQTTLNKIEETKDIIQNIGYEEISCDYLLSCLPKNISNHNFIEPSLRYEFWFNSFIDEIEENLESYNTLIDNLEITPKEELEKNFGEILNEIDIININITTIQLILENELLEIINNIIEDSENTRFIEIDFVELEKYKSLSSQIKILFDLCELFVQLNRLEIFNEILNISIEKETDNKTENKETEALTENNLTISTIEDWLYNFKDKMSEFDYQLLVNALYQYLENGIFPKSSNTIKIRGKINIKKFGWALNRIFEACGKGVELELLKFAHSNISIYANVEFDEIKYLESNLYKYFTTRIE